MLTVGCDPDTHTLAVAAQRGGEVVFAWQATVSRQLVDDAAVIETARQVAVSLAPALQKLDEPAIVVVEAMKVYPQTPLGCEGLTGLNRVSVTGGVALGALMRAFPHARFMCPTAHEWKGNRSKAAHHRQLREDLDCSMINSQRMKAHLMDAVGMAWWATQHRGQAAQARRDIQQRARRRAAELRRRRQRRAG